MKRGQITLFIIIGILVLLAVSLTLYVNQEYLKNLFEQRITRLTEVPYAIQPLDVHIKDCVSDSARLSLSIILLQGGYLDPENKINLESIDVAYWYDRKDITPSIETIEKETVKSVQEILPNCILDFNEEYSIEIKEIKPKISIKDKEVIVEDVVNLDVTYSNLTYQIRKTYNSQIESDASGIYNSAKKIIRSEIENPEYFDLTLLSGLGYMATFYRIGDAVVYSVSSENTYLNFAVK